MSQETLAELIGVTFQQVQKYEKGVNRISASRLFDIAVALKLSVAEFFDGLQYHRQPSSEESALDAVLATSDGLQLVRLFAAIKNRQVRRQVVELVRAMSAGDELT